MTLNTILRQMPTDIIACRQPNAQIESRFFAPPARLRARRLLQQARAQLTRWRLQARAAASIG